MESIFSKTVDEFESKYNYESTLRGMQKEFELKVYKLHCYNPKHGRNAYSELMKRYELRLIESCARNWNESERRLFVWFIIVFMKVHDIKPETFIPNHPEYWQQISEVFFKKDVIFLHFQYQNLFKNRQRISWIQEEDQILKEAEQNHKKGQWNQIAKEIYFRSNGTHFKTPKQCRERFQNHVNSALCKSQWKVMEIYKILKHVKQNGTKWAQIVPLMNNTRNQHMIKNKFKSLINKKKSEDHIHTDEEALDQLLEFYQKIKNIKNYAPVEFVQSEELPIEDEQDSNSLECKIEENQKGKKTFKDIKSKSKKIQKEEHVLKKKNSKKSHREQKKQPEEQEVEDLFRNRKNSFGSNFISSAFNMEDRYRVDSTNFSLKNRIISPSPFLNQSNNFPSNFEDIFRSNRSNMTIFNSHLIFPPTIQQLSYSEGNNNDAFKIWPEGFYGDNNNQSLMSRASQRKFGQVFKKSSLNSTISNNNESIAQYMASNDQIQKKQPL